MSRVDLDYPVADGDKWKRDAQKTRRENYPFGKKAGLYIEALREGMSTTAALEEARMSTSHLGACRGNDDFVAAEMGALASYRSLTPADVAPLRDRLVREWYIQALKDNAGNRTKAREAAGIGKDRYNTLCEDPAFRSAEIETLEGILDAIEEQSTRIATGDNPRARDSQHVRWALERLKKDVYGAAPKVHEHRYSGSVAIETVDAEIDRLLALNGGKIEEGVLVDEPKP